MRALYTLTIFVGSALLFLVQPMIAKMILPIFGGSPGVWNACVVFFQLVLLVGYAYAHLSTKAIGTRRQPVIHLVLIALALIVLPFGIDHNYSPSASAQPAFAVFGLLVVMVGLPFLAVSAQAPLIQKWFATTRDPRAQDPYFLYSASNLGSMLALLAYPAIIEPRLTLGGQSKLWTGGYIALGILTLGCALMLLTSKREQAATVEEVETEPDVKPTNRDRTGWVLLSAAPASLMLGITSYITTNIAPIPLLWVVPLAIYLLTFILAFSAKINPNIKRLSRVSTFFVLPVTLVLLLELWAPMLPLAALHLVVFFMLAWTCHTLLVRSRPSASHLTEFYLWMSAGGVLGGAFNGFIAPLVFDGLYEYAIALALALAIIQQRKQAEKSIFTDLAIGVGVIILLYGLTKIGPHFLDSLAGHYGEQHESAVAIVIFAIITILCFLAIDSPLRYGLVVGAVMVIGPNIKPESLKIKLQVRNFFGVKRVIRYKTLHYLSHGSTLHGIQNTDPKHRKEALTYYNPNSPIGRIFKEFRGPKAKKSLAVVGLGAGSIAAYGSPGQTITFYEIDPQVIDIATDPKWFTFIQDSAAKVDIVLGDARLEMAKASANSYDIIFLDAFSSDSIPLHLLTTEAIEMYLTKLKPGGFLAFHTSNRYLELPPVLARAAKYEGLKSIYLSMDIVSDEEEARGWTISRWQLMGRAYDDFGALGHQLMWQHMDTPPPGPIWTDDFSNVLSAFAPDES